MRCTNILFRYKVPEPNTHVPHHTQRGTDSTDGGGAFGAAPIRTIGPSLCVWCGTCVLASGTLYLSNTQYVCALHSEVGCSCELIGLYSSDLFIYHAVHHDIHDLPGSREVDFIRKNNTHYI